MIILNVPNIHLWLIKLIFFNIDFDNSGKYTREVFISYHTYRENYYYKMQNDWHMHKLSNYLGIITVWYFKPN